MLKTSAFSHRRYNCELHTDANNVEYCFTWVSRLVLVDLGGSHLDDLQPQEQTDVL
jgi:hypothetical protein